MASSNAKFFDLQTSGLGYINQIREVAPEGGDAFWTVNLAALRGSVDNVQYTHFECRVSGKQAQDLVRQLRPAVDGKLKGLIGFTLSDLVGEAFLFKQGERAGTPGFSMKARLLRISWAKVDGQPFYTERAA